MYVSVYKIDREWVKLHYLVPAQTGLAGRVELAACRIAAFDGWDGL